MILRLAHVELRVTDLEFARRFYVEVLGFTEALRVEGGLYLRASEEFDLWSLRLTPASAPGLGHCAFRVSSPAFLEELEALHRSLGLPVHRVPAGQEPGQGEALRARTPEGFPVEFVHEMEEIPLYDARHRPHLPTRHLDHPPGSRPLRIDHIHLRTPDPEGHLSYWERTLGFRAFAYVTSGERIRSAFLRRRPATHDVALATGNSPGLHHVAYYVADWNDLAYFANRLSRCGMSERIELGPTRHNLSNAFCMYIRDPSGNRLELFTGDYQRDLDREPIRWEEEDYRLRGWNAWNTYMPASLVECTGIQGPWP
ncbi:MAG: VOC family protein [Armatimonadota bacterium]|nr:VOC family protein [Armatimonadota bacterium]MDR7444728.1 VOC family protein [Armatimonadota bacterium]MDR7570885.1 VOC family protein [Armatimonadota bacterium]MDR7613267.1 VOC family protein [Armatimonadota bacterium]